VKLSLSASDLPNVADDVVFTVFLSGNDMEDSRERWLSTVRCERRTEENKVNGAALEDATRQRAGEE
jgi:hypothetical protein